MDAFKAKGNEAFKAKQFTEAIDWYTKAIEVDPNCEAAGALYSNRAACYNSLQQFDKAIVDGDNCIRVRPNWLKGYFRKAVALESIGKLDESVKAYGLSLQQEPANEEVQVKITQLNNAIRERNDKMTPARCQTADDAKKIGNSHFGNGKYVQAMEFYSRAIELTPGNTDEKANYFANRAACWQQEHAYHNVIDDCNEALAIVPTHVKALLRRAIAHEGLEKWQKALDDFNEVNRLSPGMSNVSQGVVRCQRVLRG